ncbi:OmpA/MotB domain protein [Leptonema illini DSM 21528]|uniref:OmpA/MotB domain protein n=2 Tax=Leptonema illini TaxID=183 RepID=H2CBU0_9LEPT|nr:OmpA family protein [Leptonema illini]EHQ08544.1 OmpA/MotB domain protein [Leptonema illini DSM 21528]
MLLPVDSRSAPVNNKPPATQTKKPVKKPEKKPVKKPAKPPATQKTPVKQTPTVTKPTAKKPEAAETLPGKTEKPVEAEKAPDSTKPVEKEPDTAKPVDTVIEPDSILADDEPANQMVLNHPWDDYAPLPLLHERFLVFQSARPGSTEGHDLWYSHNANYRDRTGRPQWSVPLPFAFPLIGNPSDTMQVQKPAENPPGQFSVNSDGFEGHPSIVMVGSKPVEIYLTSRRAEGGRQGYAGLNIYYARYRNNRWSELMHINEINGDYDDRMAYVTPDGKRMFFVSNRPGGYGGDDIYYTERDMRTGLWASPINLGPLVNGPDDEITPFLTANGQKLVFSSNRKGGLGGFDIYISHWNGLEFEMPLNAGRPFNSERDDEAFKLTDDGMWGYFSSDRRHTDAKGRFDIYRVAVPTELIESVKLTLTGRILDASSRLPLGMDATIHIDFELMTKVITSKRRVKNDGETIENNFTTDLYTGRSYRLRISAPGYQPYQTVLDYRGVIPAGRKDERIFYLEPIRKEATYERRLAGIVVDDATGLPLPGSTITKREADGTAVPLDVNAEGRFAVPVRNDERFAIMASSPGYVSQEQSFTETKELKEIVIRLKAGKDTNPCEAGDPQCIGNERIYFDLNSAVIKESEMKKLRAIARIMQSNTGIRIEIQGHTDLTYRGPETKSHTYNQKLSLDRANAVKQRLIELGIAADRLIVRGYSYDRPLIPVKDAVKGAINRRVEFKKID